MDSLDVFRIDVVAFITGDLKHENFEKVSYLTPRMLHHKTMSPSLKPLTTSSQPL